MFFISKFEWIQMFLFKIKISFFIRIYAKRKLFCIYLTYYDIHRIVLINKFTLLDIFQFQTVKIINNKNNYYDYDKNKTRANCLQNSEIKKENNGIDCLR